MSLGYFGKLPDRGDFVSKGVKPSLESAMHRLGSSLIVSGQERYGARFADLFAQMPLYALSAASSSLTLETFAGLFGPSTDSVGRLFPLFVLMEEPGPWQETSQEMLSIAAKIVDDAAFEKTPLHEFEERLASIHLSLPDDSKGLVLSQWSVNGSLDKSFHFAGIDEACSEASQFLADGEGGS
ncbi:MAG: type VI secretion system-associated protein TagF [Pseudomonadota bacterium]